MPELFKVILENGVPKIVEVAEGEEIGKIPTFTSEQLHSLAIAVLPHCFNIFGLVRPVHDFLAAHMWRTNLEIVCFYKGQVLLFNTGENHAFYPNKLAVPGMYPPPAWNPVSFEKLAEMVFKKYKFSGEYSIAFPGLAFTNTKTLPGPTTHVVVSCDVDEMPPEARGVLVDDVLSGRVENLLDFHSDIIELGVLHRSGLIYR